MLTMNDINKNLKWISAKINPIKPKDFNGDFFNFAVICNVEYDTGVIERQRDFIDYDFKNNKWNCDDNCKVLFYFPLPSEYETKNLFYSMDQYFLVLKKEAIENHRIMWNWIAEETLKRKEKVYKSDYFEEIGVLKDRPDNNCYCCEYNYQKFESGDGECEHCPLDWKSKVDSFMCQDKYEIDDEKGLFEQWLDETDYKKASKLARRIAKLKERE